MALIKWITLAVATLLFVMGVVNVAQESVASGFVLWLISLPLWAMSGLLFFGWWIRERLRLRRLKGDGADVMRILLTSPRPLTYDELERRLKMPPDHLLESLEFLMGRRRVAEILDTERESWVYRIAPSDGLLDEPQVSQAQATRVLTVEDRLRHLRAIRDE